MNMKPMSLYARTLRFLGGGCSGCMSCSHKGKSSCRACKNRLPLEGEESHVAHMHIGQQGIIIEIRNEEEDFIARMADYGIIRGTSITIQERGLGGGPMLIAVQGKVLALRCQEARHIFVRIGKDKD